MEKNKQSRRNFMKTSAVGASVFGLDFSMPSWLFSTNTEGGVGSVLAVAANVTFIRETLTLTQKLVDSIIAKNPDVSHLTLVANTIQLTENILIKRDVQLTLMANDINGGRRTISLSQPKNPKAAISGYSPQALTLYAKKINGLTVNTLGADGADGIAGTDFKMINYYGDKNFEAPTNGENGANGGNGGNVSILFTEFNDTIINSTAGRGGNGGKSGNGGVYCAKFFPKTSPISVPKIPSGFGGSKPGSVGGTTGTGGGKPTPPMCEREERVDSQNGSNGVNGKDGFKRLIKLSDDQWYKTVNTRCPVWSDYRVRLAEFYYRSINNPLNTTPNAALGTGLLRSRHAIKQTLEALALNPNNATAELWKTRMFNGHTPIGIQRNIDITSDVELFQDAYNQCYGAVDQIQRQADSYLQTGTSLDGFRTALDVELKGINALSNNIDTMLRNKIMPALSSKRDEIDKRIAKDRQINAAIGSRQRVIAESPLSIGEVISTVGKVVSIVSAIYTTGGAAIPAASKGLMAIFTQGKDVLGAFNSLNLETAIAQYQKGDKMTPDPESGVYKIDNVLANEALQFKDVVKKFQPQANEIINSGKSVILNIEEISRTLKRTKTGDAELDRLFQEKAANSEPVMLLRKDIAFLELDEKVAKEQIAEFQKVKQHIEGLINRPNVQNEIEEFSYMIGRATHYMKILSKFVFLTARRLEIWQFNDLTEFMRFDIGHVHPDLTEDTKYFKDIDHARELSKVFNRSWAEFASTLQLREEYVNLKANNWTTYTIRLSFKGDTINHLKTNPNDTLLFDVVPEDETLLDKKLAVIDGVKVAYIGAKMNNFKAFNAQLHQSGRLSQRLVDNSIRHAVLEGHIDTIPDVNLTALSEAIEYPTLTIKNRAVFSQYALSIPSADIAQYGIDLANLSEVQVAIRIKYTTSSVAFKLRR
jgi:hypothetical protein